MVDIKELRVPSTFCVARTTGCGDWRGGSAATLCGDRYGRCAKIWSGLQLLVVLAWRRLFAVRTTHANDLRRATWREIAEKSAVAEKLAQGTCTCTCTCGETCAYSSPRELATATPRTCQRNLRREIELRTCAEKHSQSDALAQRNLLRTCAEKLAE